MLDQILNAVEGMSQRLEAHIRATDERYDRMADTLESNGGAVSALSNSVDGLRDTLGAVAERTKGFHKVQQNHSQSLHRIEEHLGIGPETDYSG